MTLYTRGFSTADTVSISVESKKASGTECGHLYHSGLIFLGT
jgi:hypothetical protein